MNIQMALARMGIETGNPIETNYDHHEVAPSQHEIDLQHLDALEMADVAMIHRFITKEIARKEGLYATFMPKPLFGENGSGMHVHQSLWKGNTNTFFSNDASKNHLSDTALHYVAGLFMHVNEITAVLCQWINSYKRLVPGYEAPVYHAIGTRNRSALIRVPEYEPGKEHATRIELRCPDPACNPYLAFALMLAAGLDGIENKYPHNKFIGNESMYDLTEEQLKDRKIKTLPGSLSEALTLFRSSTLARKTMGDHLFSKFVENKEKELQDYEAWLAHFCGSNKARPEEFRLKVTSYEYEHYLPRL
jgi:glutamine synthetase